MGSYIAFELDAMEQVPNVAAACALSEAQVGWGLAKLWRWCWREKVDRVSRLHLRGFFGVDVGDALEAFGFVATDGEGLRVRGAERYLRIAAGRSKGGQKAKGNLKRGKARPKPEGEPETKPGPSREAPPASLRLTPGSTANSEQRTASSEVESIAPKAPRETDLLKTVFASTTGVAYHWQGEKDGVAFHRLRKEFSMEEILDRWRRGLRASGWQKVATVAQLASKWNDLAPDPGFVGHGPLTATEGSL